MADREVREPKRAYSQHIERLTTSVRELKLRAYRGAVRTAHADAVSPGIYNEYISVLEAVVPSGRWLVNGVATFTVAAPVTSIDLRLQVAVFDPLTDEPAPLTHSDVPPAQYRFAATSLVIFTAYCDGDIIADDNVKVTLQSANFAEDAYSLTNVRLTLDPV